MVRAYLISFVARQALLLKDKLPARYPNAWLVWEPGNWSAPAVQGNESATRMPTSQSAVTAPQHGDALCFELSAPPAAGSLRLGRATGNDIIINDATVSREHILLAKQTDGRWSAEATSQAKSTFFGSCPLPPGQKVALADGQKLKVGDVVFTYLEPASFFERVSGVAGSLR
jgi:hypothetical protein